MKKLLPFWFILIAGNVGYAQDDSLSTIPVLSGARPLSKFYVKFYSGYGILSPGSYKIQSNNTVSYYDQFNVYQDTTVQSQGKKGLGQGLRVGAGIGYVLNDFLNLGIDVEYGKSVKMKNSLGTQLAPYDYDSVSDNMNYKALTITPYVTFKVLSKPNYFFYNKLGILFTLPVNLHTSGTMAHSRSSFWPPLPMDSVNSNLNVVTQRYQGSYRLSLGIGFNVSFGVNVRLNNSMRLFGEIFGNFSALAPSQSTINWIKSEKYSYYSPEYDYTTDPPVLLYYQQNSNTRLSYEKYITEYHKGGPTTRVSEEVEYLPGDPDPHWTYKDKDKRFTANMNAVGLSVGIIYRL